MEGNLEKVLKVLLGKLFKSRNKRNNLKNEIINELGSIDELIPVFIEPECSRMYLNTTKMWDSYNKKNNYDFIFNAIKNIITSKKYDSHNQILVLADAGMGKTSLLKMIAYKQGYNFFLPKKYDVRVFKIDDNLIEKLEKIENPSKTLLLLDSLDEDYKAWENFNERINELLNASKKFYRTIITSRAQFLEYRPSETESIRSVTICGFELQTLYILPFFNYQVEDYVERKYKVLKTDNELKISSWSDFKMSVYRILNSMKDLKMRPMLLNHIDDFMDDELLVWNQYTVFKRLIYKWLHRELTKASHNKHNTSECKFNDEFNELKACCIDLAIYAQNKEISSITDDSLNYIFRENNKKMMIRSIDLNGKTLLFRNSKGNYMFSHYTIQEFLIAHAFLYRKDLEFNADVLITETIRKFVFEGSEYEKIVYTNIGLNNLADLKKNENQIIINAFSETGISGVSLERSVGVNWYLRNVNIEEFNVKLSLFNKLYFEGSSFENIVAKSVIFKNLEASNTKFLNCQFEKIQFESCNFTNSEFNNVDISESQIINDHLENMEFINSTISKNTEFEISNFKNILFDSVELNSISLVTDNIFDLNIINSKIIKTFISSNSIADFKITNSTLDEESYNAFQKQGAKFMDIIIIKKGS